MRGAWDLLAAGGGGGGGRLPSWASPMLGELEALQRRAEDAGATEAAAALRTLEEEACALIDAREAEEAAARLAGETTTRATAPAVDGGARGLAHHLGGVQGTCRSTWCTRTTIARCAAVGRIVGARAASKAGRWSTVSPITSAARPTCSIASTCRRRGCSSSQRRSPLRSISRRNSAVASPPRSTSPSSAACRHRRSLLG